MRDESVDWTKIFLGGIVILGGYATYRMVTAEDEAPKLPPGPPPRPDAPWINVPGLPAEPPPLSSQGVAYLGSPVPLRQGKRYRALLKLGTLEAMALALTDKKQAVASRFSDLGFRDVRVWDKLQDLPSDWPTETLLQPDPNALMLEGVWEKESAQIPRPTQVTKAWEG